MQFVIKAFDGENKLEKRLAVRARHSENLTKINGKVICGGGMLDEEGKMKGSVIILDVESRDRLEEYLSSEPYIVEHVWEKIEIEPMNVAIVNGEKVGK